MRVSFKKIIRPSRQTPRKNPMDLINDWHNHDYAVSNIRVQRLWFKQIVNVIVSHFRAINFDIWFIVTGWL
jgi:hypothetical protein